MDMAGDPQERGDSMTVNDPVSRLDGVDLLAAARGGCPVALGTLFESSRQHLLIAARRELPRRFRGQLGASDMVQDAVAEGHRSFHTFRGGSAADFVAWMRALLNHSMIDTFRRCGAAKRMPKGMQQRLSALDSGDDVLAYRSADLPDSHAIRREEAGAVHAALKTLAPDHRRVLWLRHWEGRSFAEIGGEMGRSADAARKLWCRAFEQFERALDAAPRAPCSVNSTTSCADGCHAAADE